jgi:hypothetical protein
VSVRRKSSERAGIRDLTSAGDMPNSIAPTPLSGFISKSTASALCPCDMAGSIRPVHREALGNLLPTPIRISMLAGSGRAIQPIRVFGIEDFRLSVE